MGQWGKTPNKKRKYEENYLNMGFTETNDGRLLCVICGNVLTNSSMFPAKLRRHFEGNRPELKDKPSDFFFQQEEQRNFGFTENYDNTC